MPPPRQPRLRPHEIMLLGFGLACAGIVVATEDAPRLTTPVMPYRASETGGVIGPVCRGIEGLLRCR